MEVARLLEDWMAGESTGLREWVGGDAPRWGGQEDVRRRTGDGVGFQIRSGHPSRACPTLSRGGLGAHAWHAVGGWAGETPGSR